MSNKHTNNYLTDIWSYWSGRRDAEFSGQNSVARVELQALEDRVLYSAGPIPVEVFQTAEVVNPGCEFVECGESVESQLENLTELAAAFDGSASDWDTLAPWLPGNSSVDVELSLDGLEATSELVIVDRSVQGYERLVDDLQNQATSGRNFEIEYLDPEANGVSQISRLLSTRSGLTAVHLITHGEDGELQIGQSTLNNDSLAGYEQEISNWKLAFRADADLLIYGCNVAETELGEQFVEQLAELLETDLSASSDVTGHASIGGDWNFEYVVGVVETENAFSEEIVSNWDHSLAPPATGSPTDLSSGIEINSDGGNNLYFAANNGNSTDLLNGLDNLTVEVTFSLDEVIMRATLLSYSIGGQDEMLLIVDDNGEFYFEIGNQSEHIVGPFNELFDGDRHHLAFSWNSSGGIAQLYIDGQLQATIANVQEGGTLQEDGILVIGQNLSTAGGSFEADDSFHGTLHDVRIWNEDRTAKEIGDNYQHKFDASGIPDSLVANWQMTELAGAENLVVDLVNPGTNDLTLLSITPNSFFSSSTASDELVINENASNGDSVGYVIPTDIDFVESIVSDGAFNSYYVSGTDKETFAFDGSYSGNQFGDWTVVANAVDVRGTNWETSPGGGEAVDLAGGISSGVNGLGVIEQTLTTVVGQEYQVSFQMSGNFEATETVQSLNVNVGGNSTGFTINEPAGWSEDNLQWQFETMTFVATSTSTVLQFEATSGDARGAIIGDVNVVALPVGPIESYTYSLVDNAGGRFEIDSASGEITVLDGSLLDYESESYYDLIVEVQDGAGPAFQAVTTVQIGNGNDSPLVGTNVALILDEGSADNTITSAQLNEGDPDDSGAEVTYTVTSDVFNGTLYRESLSLSQNSTFTQADIDAGLVTYDHDGSESSSDSFDFSLADGGEGGSLAVTGTFNFTVEPVNVAPSFTSSGASFDEDSTGNQISMSMLNETDPDDSGAGLTYALVVVPQNGALYLGGTELAANEAFTQADIDTGQLTYDHDGTETTSDSFDFSLSDGGEDSVLPATGSFAITINSLNDSPGVVNNGADIFERTAGNVITNVMLGETDPDDQGGGLNYTLTGIPLEGDLRLDGTVLIVSDTFTQADVDAGRLTYDHTAVVPTSDSFDFSLADGGENSSTPQVGTFNFNVSAVGTESTAVGDSFVATEDQTYDSNAESTNLLDNDFDSDGDAFGVVEHAEAANGAVVVNSDGSYVYTPNENFNGPDSFTYLITDEITDLQHHYGLDGNANDLIGGVDGTLNGTTTIAGSQGNGLQFDGLDDHVELGDVSYATSYTLTFDFKLDDLTGSAFQYLYSHGGLQTNNSVNIFVGETSNFSAGILRTAVYDANDSTALATTDFLNVNVSAFVGDSSWHRYTLVVESGVGAKVYVDGSHLASSSFGEDSFNPTGSAFLGARNDLDANRMLLGGIDAVQLYSRAFNAGEATDLTRQFSEATVTINVDSVNDAPVAHEDHYHVGQGATTTIEAGQGVVFNDHDVDGDAIVASYSNASNVNPAHGTVTVNTDGSFSYVHDGSDTTSDSFTYTLTDSVGATSEAIVNLEIEATGLTAKDEILVNEDIIDSPLGQNQDTHQAVDHSDSAVATADNGDYVIVWTGSDGTDDHAFMRKFDFSGTPLTDSFEVGAGLAAGNNQGASVAMAGDGKFVVVWANEDTGGATADGSVSSIYFQTYNADGSVDGAATRVTNADYSNGSQIKPDVAMNASGQFAITWSGDGFGGDGDDAYVNVFNAAGTSLTGGAQVLNSGGGSIIERNVSVAMADDGNAITFWDDGTRLHGKAFNVSGAFDISSSVEIKIPAIANALQIKGASLDVDNSTGLVALAFQVQVSDGSGGDYWETQVHVLDLASPTLASPSEQFEFSEDQTAPSISFGNDGDLVMVWQGSGTGDTAGIFVRRFEVLTNSDGDPYASSLGEEFLANQTTSGSQLGASVSAIDSQNFVAVWSGQGAGDSNGVFARQFGTQADVSVSGRVLEMDFTNPTDDSDATRTAGSGLAGTTVKLYEDDGDGVIDADDLMIRELTTGVSGQYSFTGLVKSQAYWVVVDSKTIDSGPFNGGFDSTDAWAEQVYGDGGSKIGGLQAGVSDDASSLLTSQHVSEVDLSGNVTGLDFGFSFNVVSNVLAGGAQDDDASDDALVDKNQRSVQGSLRQFMTNANAISGANEMHFVPGIAASDSLGGDSWWEVVVAETLPELTDGETTLDGRAYADDGLTRLNANTLLLGTGGSVGLGADGIQGTADDDTIAQLDAPELEIWTANSVEKGLFVSAGNVEISYVSIHGFGNSSTVGANVFVGVNGDDAKIHHNLLGSEASEFDIAATVSSSSNNVLVDRADGGEISDNLIGFTGYVGVAFNGAKDNSDGVSDWLLTGNEIISDSQLEGYLDGVNVRYFNSDIRIIGNLIANHGGMGIDTWESTNGILIDNNTISGNGFDFEGSSGVRLFADSNVVTQNVISGNAYAGVHVVGLNSISGSADASVGNLISQNSFYDNGSIAIDLSSPGGSVSEWRHGDGIDANDGATDSNRGNHGFDHPVLTSASVHSDGLQLHGVMQGTLTGQTLELYIANSGAGDTSGGQTYGEGEIYLGSVSESDVVSFNATTGVFEVLLATPVGGWPLDLTTGEVTALAIESATSNTSEFSNTQAISADLPPVFAGNALTINENETSAGNVIATDPNGSGITYSLSGGTDQGLFQIDAVTGELTFVSAPDYELPIDSGLNALDNIYEVEVAADDGSLGPEPSPIYVTVTNIDEALVAMDDAYSVDEGGRIVSDVMLNDLDPDGNVLGIRLTTQPAHGLAFINESGRLVYQNDGNEFTTDSVEYVIYDADGAIDQATVIYTINPINDQTFVGDDRFRGEIGELLVIPTSKILANDYDPDSSISAMTLVITNPPSSGLVKLVGNQLFFKPADDFTGTETIQYQLQSGDDVSNTGTITIVISPGVVDRNEIDEKVDEIEDEVDKIEETEDESDDGLEATGSGESAGEAPDENEHDSLVPARRTNEDLTNSLVGGVTGQDDVDEGGRFRLSDGLVSYAYASRSGGLSLVNLASAALVQGNFEKVTEFEVTLLAGIAWQDLDAAKRDFLQGELQLGVQEIAASAASFLTVGYVAWVIRGGVLLTTFMSSVPAWSSFDIQSLIESASSAHDESIEQIVDS